MFILQDISIFRVEFPLNDRGSEFSCTESADSEWRGDVKVAAQPYLNKREFPEAELNRISPRSPALIPLENVFNLLKRHSKQQAISAPY